MTLVDQQRIYSFPGMGKYTPICTKVLSDLGVNYIKPPEITSETVKLGVKYSPEMMCYPFKIVLGTFIECIEAGATDLLMFNTCGQCRYRQYYKLFELMLTDLGYDFRMHQIRKNHLIRDAKRACPNASYLKVATTTWSALKRITELEKVYDQDIDPGGINIGIIGEIFTVLEPRVNCNIFKMLKDMDCHPITHVGTKSLFGSSFWKSDPYWTQALSYLDGGVLGGHAPENIRDTLKMTKEKIDGIVHLLPLSCMPETTIEPIIDRICLTAGVPMLRLQIDETNSRLNVETRLETFVELIKRKKRQVRG